jgi:hypothetical protein
LVKVIKSSDKYAHPISLNFKGNPTFKTFIGGFLTLLLLGGFIYYSITEILTMMERKRIGTTKNEIYVDLSNEAELHLPRDDGFDIAFRVVPSAADVWENPEMYYRLYAYHYNKTFDPVTSEVVTVTTEIELED